MTPCAVCKDYPAGTACSMTGCPGRTFKLSRVPYKPDDFDDWLESINAELFRLVEENETVSTHNGGVSK